jgi:hypothetical protein
MKKNSLFPVFSVLLMSFGLSACSSLGLSSDATYSDKARDKTYEHGSVASDKGGIDILGTGKDQRVSDASGMGVNGYLWRATLDTIAFMPIVSADPFGGLINTDWYSAPGNPDERTKLNIFILDRELRADGVRVSVFRQTRLGSSNEWHDAGVSPTTASQLEETILTRARQLRLAQKEQK